ncbi:MAG: hypothetical protein KKH44_12765 [Bacteroidetes bacterium]|nr:hypothetical protein [Bacteroidota bacterium]
MILRKLFLVLICAMVCTYSYADQNPMLIGYPPQKIMGFRGLDTQSTAPIIPDGRSPDLQNVKISRSLDLQKRYGYDPVNITLDDFDSEFPPITGIFDASFSDGTNKALVFLGTQLKYDYSGVWKSINNWYDGRITSGANYQWQCIMALDTAVCTNDTDLPLEITTTPVMSVLDMSDLSSAVTKVKTLIWWKNYLIIGNTVDGGTERPVRFRWTDVGTTESWSDANYIDVSSLGGDEINAFVELYGDLYILLLNSIWRVSYVGGTDTFVLNKVIENIGTVARDSVQVVTLEDKRRAIVFLDDDKKIYIFDGASLLDLGYIIQPTLDDLNAARLQYAVSVFDGKSYYLSASTGSNTENDTIYEFQTEIGEWLVHTDINANAIGRVKISTSDIRTYFGNYDAFVYWIDNPDYDSDGGNGIGYTGVVDSVTTINTGSATGLQFLVDADVTFGLTDLTGCIVKITSGTGAGEEQVIAYNMATGLAVTTAFTTTPDSTSNYSIGAIDAYYKSRWFDLGNSASKKSFRKLYLWAKEDTGDEVTVSFAEDFGSTLGTTTKSLSPSSNSLWDSAIWGEGIWGTTGDKFYDVLLRGKGKTIQVEFSNNEADETFHIYGYHILADDLGVE